MNPVDLIEKAISEHGSAKILKTHLAFAKDQFVALERRASELEREIGNLQAKLQREQVERDKAQQEARRLQLEHEEQVSIHNAIEFRKGKRTGTKWLPFCPNCHMPAEPSVLIGKNVAICSKRCGWHARIQKTLEFIARELEP